MATQGPPLAGDGGASLCVLVEEMRKESGGSGCGEIHARGQQWGTTSPVRPPAPPSPTPGQGCAALRLYTLALLPCPDSNHGGQQGPPGTGSSGCGPAQWLPPQPSQAGIQSLRVQSGPAPHPTAPRASAAKETQMLHSPHGETEAGGEKKITRVRSQLELGAQTRCPQPGNPSVVRAMGKTWGPRAGAGVPKETPARHPAHHAGPRRVSAWP